MLPKEGPRVGRSGCPPTVPAGHHSFLGRKEEPQKFSKAKMSHLFGAAPGAKEGGGNSPSRARSGLGWGGRERWLFPLESVLKVLIIACVFPG